MPCYLMQTIQVTLEGRSPVVLKLALEAMGYRVTVSGESLAYANRNQTGTYTNGVLTSYGAMDLVALKKAYSAEVIKAKAKKFGWQLVPTKTGYTVKKGSDKMDVQILADGGLKVTTGKVSAPNHMNAEALLLEVKKEMGGDVVTKRNGGQHSHGHTHTHADGTTHTH